MAVTEIPNWLDWLKLEKCFYFRKYGVPPQSGGHGGVEFPCGLRVSYDFLADAGFRRLSHLLVETHKRHHDANHRALTWEFILMDRDSCRCSCPELPPDPEGGNLVP